MRRISSNVDSDDLRHLVLRKSSIETGLLGELGLLNELRLRAVLRLRGVLLLRRVLLLAVLRRGSILGRVLGRKCLIPVVLRRGLEGCIVGIALE